ncbi:ABC transporter permease [Prolixibacteraceae bacterium JC049]|nr:ABC transporter permease [Prolixibacteraceae bacterium JC049]
MLKKIKDNISELGFHFNNELKTVFSDSGAVLLLVAAVLMYPIFYSIAYSGEALRDLNIAIVDLDNTGTSRKLTRIADATEQLKVATHSPSLKEAKELFNAGDVNGVLLIPEGFEKKIFRGETSPLSVYCDVSYFLMYKQALTGATYASSALGAGVEIKRLMAQGYPDEKVAAMREPLAVKTYTLYNPLSGYGTFVMPGMMLLIIQQTLLIGIGVVGGTRRERHQFYPELGSGSIGKTAMMLWGKASAYLLIYLINAIFNFIWINRWFRFPEKGSLMDVLILMVPFLLATAFLGLAVSVLFRKRVHAMLFLTFSSPIVLFLSGISWPAQSIPTAIYKIAQVLPSTLMVPAYLRVRTMGVELFQVNKELSMMILQVAIYWLLATVAYQITFKFKQKKEKMANN